MIKKTAYVLFVAIYILSFSVLVLAETKESKKTPVEGRIVSDYGPVEGATVRLPGTNEFTRSNKEGYFLFPLRLNRFGNTRITVGKEGWFNNGGFIVPGRDFILKLTPLPRVDNPHYKFLSPSVCAECHVELSKIYDKSKMAHTTSNPKVLQMYNGTDATNKKNNGPGYKLDYPDDTGDCATCHAPSVESATPSIKDLNIALISSRLETDGISCDYCHKVKRITKSKSTPSGYKAHHLRQTPNSGNSILVMGPYDDVAVPPMAASYNPLFKEGLYCSQCHSHRTNLNNEWNWKKIYSEEEWKAFGFDDKALPIQTTYQEWKQWQSGLDEGDPNSGKKCQDCHMSWRKEMLPYGNHVVDGHARMMWASHRQSQNIHPHQFDGGTAIQLKTAASVEVEAEIKGDVLIATVFVSNTNGGHWVPTGEPMRSVMLVVETEDENEKSLELISGSRLPRVAGEGDRNKGNYAEEPGILFAKIFADAKGNTHVPFWNAVTIVSDNRLRPKQTVTFKWQFKLPDPDSEPSVVARLIYRPVDKKLAASKKWQVEDIPIAEAAW